MSDARPRQVQDIESLLAERRKYEQWLAQLESKKESTPAHVFLKVHGDYSARLADAQKKLSSETGSIRTLAAELEEKLSAQETHVNERADERAEAELRAAVGEFGAKEWEKLRTKLDGAIADLMATRESIQKELTSLRELLAAADPSSAEEPKRDVDDIAFLRSVLGRSTPYSNTPNTPNAPNAPAPTAIAASVPATVEPEPAVEPPVPRVSAAVPAPARTSEAGLERVSEPSPLVEESFEPPPSLEQPLRSMPSQGESSQARKSSEQFAMPEMPEAPLAPRGTDDARPTRPSGTFGQATPRTSEAVKSLKCQECGTLNYPTEWYCERCGGELAAF